MRRLAAVVAGALAAVALSVVAIPAVSVAASIDRGFSAQCLEFYSDIGFDGDGLVVGLRCQTWQDVVARDGGQARWEDFQACVSGGRAVLACLDAAPGDGGGSSDDGPAPGPEPVSVLEPAPGSDGGAGSASSSGVPTARELMDDPKVCDEMASAWDEHACDLLRAAGRAMRPEVSAGGFRDGPWKSVYATCFGLGLLVMVVVLLLGHARAADGAKVSGFELLAGLGVRSFLFVPAMTALPAAVALAWGLADSMAGSFEAEAGSTLFDVMYAELLEYVGGLGLQIVTGLGLFSIDNVIAALVTGVCLLVSWVLIQLELIVATFGVYLITCLAPLGIALSLYPAQRGVAKAILSALAGVVLIKPALWLVLWVGSVTVLDQVGSPEAGDWRASVSLIVLSLTAAAAPALAPKVLSKLVGPGVDAAWGREGLGAAWGVVKGAGREGFHDVKQYLRTRDEPRAADDATGGGGEAGGAPARAADGPAETVGPVPEPAGGVSPVAVPAGGARGAGGPPGVPVGGAGGAGAAPGAGQAAGAGGGAAASGAAGAPAATGEPISTAALLLAQAAAAAGRKAKDATDQSMGQADSQDRPAGRRYPAAGPDSGWAARPPAAVPEPPPVPPAGGSQRTEGL